MVGVLIATPQRSKYRLFKQPAQETVATDNRMIRAQESPTDPVGSTSLRRTQTGRRFLPSRPRRREHYLGRISGDLAEPVRRPAEAAGAARGDGPASSDCKEGDLYSPHYTFHNFLESFSAETFPATGNVAACGLPRAQTRPHRPIPRSRGPLHP